MFLSPNAIGAAMGVRLMLRPSGRSAIFLLATMNVFPSFADAVSLKAVIAEREVLPNSVIPVHYRIDITPDAKGLTFKGSLEIDVIVRQATDKIVLNSADLVIENATLSGEKSALVISYDSKVQTATLVLSHTLRPGPYTVRLSYHGKVYQAASGLFALDYDTQNGKARALYTQFEVSEARRFMPCWDEPNRKATFQLNATVPAEQMTVSNMPIASTETLPLGLKRVHFGQTPRMSSYLLFFGVGDFERVHRTVDGVDVGVVVKRGDSAKATYALDAAAEILPYYEEYFGVRYPLPKLDLIAGPGESQYFGAMENWGAIFSFESVLLVDPKISSQEERRWVYTATAHEMAHQWFGDLVTMDWWDDIWLNEGFASWMETKVSNHFHPDWKPWLDVLRDKAKAMQLDARIGTHPIVQSIRDVQQAALAFDQITYLKGRAVIRMVEEYLGEDAFRGGVRAYIKAHQHGNTVTDDFWRALEHSSHAPVISVAHDFTLQAGVPLIRVSERAGAAHLSQEGFAYDESGAPSTSWRVPVAVSGDGDTQASWRGLVSRGNPRDVAIRGKALLIVNSGQSGYFRTLYNQNAIDRIVLAFAGMAPADQLGLLSDSSAMGYAGLEPLGDFLELARQLKPDMESLVLIDATRRLTALNDLYSGLSGQRAFKVFGRGVLNPLYAALGWSERPGEAQNVTRLRGEVLVALSKFDEPSVISEAQVRFAKYLEDPSALTGDLRRNVLTIVAEHADAATWNQMHLLARSAGSALEKSKLYEYLGSAHDSGLAQGALELALSDEAPVTTRPAIVRATADFFPEAALDFAIAHYDALEGSIEPASRSRYVPSLAAKSNDLRVLGKLHSFAAEHIPEGARDDEVKAEANIRFSAKVRVERLPEVDRWLAIHGD